MTALMILVWIVIAALAALQVWLWRSGRISAARFATRIGVHAIFLTFLSYVLAHAQ